MNINTCYNNNKNYILTGKMTEEIDARGADLKLTTEKNLEIRKRELEERIMEMVKGCILLKLNLKEDNVQLRLVFRQKKMEIQRLKV
jgi:hypothetical protein